MDTLGGLIRVAQEMLRRAREEHGTHDRRLLTAPNTGVIQCRVSPGRHFAGRLP